MDNGAPLRVAFCHYTADVCGGSDGALYNIVTHLPRERFEPILFLRTGDPLAGTYRDQGFEVHELTFHPPRRALELAKLLRFFFFFWPAVFRLAWLYRRCRIDVVHVNTVFNLQGGVAAWAARIPLVWHVRELVPESRAAAAILQIAARLSTRIIAISTAVADTIPKTGVHLILDAIDLRNFEVLPDPAAFRSEWNLSPATPVVTLIGRMEEWKGQHVFIEAVPEILRACPEAQCFLVGGAAVNKPHYLPQLQERCAQLGIDGAVHFTGIRNDIPAVLAATTVLVLPSVTPEPFGLTVIEAMAAGVPVVATAQGGPLEVVTPGKSGLLVPPGDAPALASAITEILGNPELRDAMSKSARGDAFERFSFDRVRRQVGDVLLSARKR